MKTILIGTVCSPGTAKGFIQWSEPENSQIEKNKIWIIEGPLSPSLVIRALRSAVALMTTSGGRTSHGAILAREGKLPVLILPENIEHVRKLKYCEVDAFSGTATFYYNE